MLISAVNNFNKTLLTYSNKNQKENHYYTPVYDTGLKQDRLELSFQRIKPSAINFLKNKRPFQKEAMNPKNPKWNTAIARVSEIDKNKFDTRTEFERDKDRIIHTDGFAKMRLKTQVFPVCEDDTVTTRSIHVLLVADISRNISKKLGLNEELTEAIALGHDIGHAPFGHDGEASLKNITRKEGLPLFWHEKNSLRMTDKLLTLKNNRGEENNLGLTYAVRDGIINHCGEVDENFIKPRNEVIDLNTITRAGQVQPYTWEGAVVKISDKIAYLGKDIEDASKLGIFSNKNFEDLKNIAKKDLPEFEGEVTNTSLVNLFVNDIIDNSNPQKGIGFSEPVFKFMNDVKEYNYKNIYKAPNAKNMTQDDCDKVIGTIYTNYLNKYNGENTVEQLKKEDNKHSQNFAKWLTKYTVNKTRPDEFKNTPVYNIENKKEYKQAIVDYISGMTDNYALKTYDDIKTAKSTK
ncbi:MAG: HD domain-containing protein [Candidatus Gastranaerophilales bacterium]|nr:HD domain-containing protein [Candidatus Gastranaerophilales bacterium]